MRCLRALPLAFLVPVLALFCPVTTDAQIPSRLQRCLPYPTFAEEVETMHQEVEMKETESAPPEPEKDAVIDSVTFDGPISLPPSVRERAVAELKQEVHDFSPARLDEIVEVWVRGTWQDQGYFRVQATGKGEVVGGDATHQHIALTFHVDEGRQYFLGDLEFRSSDPDEPLVFPTEDLRKLLDLHEGDIFNTDKVRRSLELLRQLYGSEGYIDLTAEPTFDVDDVHQRVSLTLVLDQEKQFHIGKVEVLGPNSTTENALRSKLKSGDVFRGDALKEFLEENKSALPSDASLADVSLKRDVKTGIVDLTFNFFICPQLQD